MAYCRWGADGSDVYVYANVGGGVVCCACEMEGSWAKTNAEMIEHLLKHREAGHTVPEYAIDRLRNEPDNVEHSLEAIMGAQ